MQVGICIVYKQHNTFSVLSDFKKIYVILTGTT